MVPVVFLLACAPSDGPAHTHPNGNPPPPALTSMDIPPECRGFGPLCQPLDSLVLAELILPPGLIADDVLWGDLSGDGVGDLVVNARTDDWIETILVFAGPYVEGVPAVATIPGASAEHVGDTDGDGAAELWVNANAAPNSVVRIGGPLVGTVALPPDLGWVVASPRPVDAAATVGDLVQREWADVNGDGLADVVTRTAWDLRLYLAPHASGAAPALTIEYPECEWEVKIAGTTLYAVPGVDSDGSGPDEIYVNNRKWPEDCGEVARLGFYLPASTTGVVDVDAPPAGALVGVVTGGDGVTSPLFDLDGDGAKQWADRRVGTGLAVSRGPAPSLDAELEDPALLAGTLLIDSTDGSLLVQGIVPDATGGEDAIVEWGRDDGEAWLRLSELAGDLDVSTTVHYASDADARLVGVEDYLGLGRPQMLIGLVQPYLIAELP